MSSWRYVLWQISCYAMSRRNHLCRTGGKLSHPPLAKGVGKWELTRDDGSGSAEHTVPVEHCGHFITWFECYCHNRNNKEFLYEIGYERQSTIWFLESNLSCWLKQRKHEASIFALSPLPRVVDPLSLGNCPILSRKMSEMDHLWVLHHEKRDTEKGFTYLHGYHLS